MRLPHSSLWCGLLVAWLVFVAAAFGFEIHEARAAASVAVEDLKCEFLVEPLGLDVQAPRLSWRLGAVDPGARGQRQTSYHILAATSLDLLSSGQADLWDSGPVTSSQSHLIPYGGTSLESGTRCYWKVRVADEQGRLSAWSEPSFFSTGILDPEEWNAQWIGAGGDFDVPTETITEVDCTLQDPWLRKTFELASDADRAELYVASAGYHELYVNGQRVSEAVLQPATSDLSQRALYATYDVAPFLRKGKNVVALWLGTSWSIFPFFQTPDKPAAPIALVQGEIHLSNGGSQPLLSDASWKTHPSPNRLLGAWMFMNYGGEHYDAQLEKPGWNTADFDDSDWAAVTVCKPRLRLSAQRVEPNLKLDRLDPIGIEKKGPDTWRVDMGTNFAGFLEVDVVGEPGSTIKIHSSERTDRETTWRIFSEYVIGPSGRGTFRNRFNYHSGRWVTLKGLSRAPRLEDVRGYLVRSGFERSGRFECSDDRVNRVYDKTLWTFENLAVGGYLVDCPQRERMGYGGDGHATIRTGLNNYGLGGFCTNWAKDWRDIQQPSGYVPYTAPTYWGGGGAGWSTFCMTLPWQHYRWHGDRDLLKECYPTAQRLLAYFDANSQDGLLTRLHKKDAWAWIDDDWMFLGDWLWPGMERETGSDSEKSLLINNCIWVYGLEVSARIAETIGEDDDASAYRKRADEVRCAIHNRWFVAEDSSYFNGEQALLALALVAGVPPEEVRAQVWERLADEITVKHNGHIFAGITGGAFLFQCLMEADRNDLIYGMATKEDYPGWIDMLDSGETTFREAWDQSRSDGSRLHASYLYIGSWPIRGLAGIAPGPEGGFSQFRVRPALFPDDPPLEWARGSYDSSHGQIESAWSRTEDGTELTLSIPPNTAADVYLPAADAAAVTEGSLRLPQVAGVEKVDPIEEGLRVRVLPGHYVFKMPE